MSAASQSVVTITFGAITLGAELCRALKSGDIPNPETEVLRLVLSGKLVPWRGNSADAASLVGLGRMTTQDYAALKNITAEPVWFLNEELLKLGLITPDVSGWQSAEATPHAEPVAQFKNDQSQSRECVRGIDRTEIRQVRLASDATTPLQVFDDACISRLAALAKLPEDADLTKFADSVRSSVLNYLQAKERLSPNELHGQIERLCLLASKQQYAALAMAVEAMSADARARLNGRYASIKDRMPNWRIPSVAELQDPATCAKAADGLIALLEFGEEWVLGRNRPSGRRSITRRSVTIAPTPSRAQPRRDAERDFVMWLQIALARAGAKVPVTAHHDKPGPVTRMVGECLLLAGATGAANAVGLAVQIINDLKRSGGLSGMNS
jgi:hypothetical protein